MTQQSIRNNAATSTILFLFYGSALNVATKWILVIDIRKGGEFGLGEKEGDEDIYSRLNEIVLDRKRLLLKKPIGISSDFRDGVWIMENKDFGILCMSTDYKECLGDFYEEVFFIWEQYGQEDDDKLTNDAKELKRKILEHVGE